MCMGLHGLGVEIAAWARALFYLNADAELTRHSHRILALNDSVGVVRAWSLTTDIPSVSVGRSRLCNGNLLSVGS